MNILFLGGWVILSTKISSEASKPPAGSRISKWPVGPLKFLSNKIRFSRKSRWRSRILFLTGAGVISTQQIYVIYFQENCSFLIDISKCPNITYTTIWFRTCKIYCFTAPLKSRYRMRKKGILGICIFIAISWRCSKTALYFAYYAEDYHLIMGGTFSYVSPKSFFFYLPMHYI